MDVETINETGHIIITIIISMLLVTVITSATFLGKVKNLVRQTVPEHESYSYQSDLAFEEYIKGIE